MHVVLSNARLGRGIVFDDEIAAQATGCASDAISEVGKPSEIAGNSRKARARANKQGGRKGTERKIREPDRGQERKGIGSDSGEQRGLKAMEDKRKD